jgi:hypothetical protein
MHWTDQYYGVGKTDPITYTPGIEKRKATVITQSTEMPIAEQQGRDITSAAILTNKDGQPVLSGASGRVWAALAAVFPANILKLLFAMLYMESGGFSNRPFAIDNNPGNIMWDKRYWPLSKRGVYVAANKSYAVHFSSLNEFANTFYQYMTKGSRPLDATSVEDFVHRLALNHYFGSEPEASYLAKIKATLERLKMLDTFYKTTREKMLKDANPPKENWFIKHPIITAVLIVAGLSATAKIFK